MRLFKSQLRGSDQPTEIDEAHMMHASFLLYDAVITPMLSAPREAVAGHRSSILFPHDPSDPGHVLARSQHRTARHPGSSGKHWYVMILHLGHAAPARSRSCFTSPAEADTWALVCS